MAVLHSTTINQLFLEARTFRFFLPTPVPDALLREAYEIAKWGPTSVNLQPMRAVFVKSESEKAKLLSCLEPGNVEKVRSAPVTVIIAQDELFFEKIEYLAPQAAAYKAHFISSQSLAHDTAFRNSSLQGAYLMIALRSLGLDCGPISGFNHEKIDQAFFAGSSLRSNFICNIGHGDKGQQFPRAPRLAFDEVCKIL